MKRNSLLLKAAIAGMLTACSSAPSTPEEAEVKNLNSAKVVDAPAAPAEVAAEKGECHGINACKGKGACGGPGYSCAGNNACKGKGWISMTEADCKIKKGTFKR